MRVVIDMQGAQTASRFRGIGRYTMSFTKAVVRNSGEHEVILALSGLFPDTIEPIRAEFDGLLPQENIRVWHAPGPVRECKPGNDGRRRVAEVLREAFLASLNPDIIHVCSLFEGFVDDAVTSIGVFDTRTPVSIILYDLIPLLNPDLYLKTNPSYHSHYMRKIEQLKRASLLLAISNYSAMEAMEHLHFPKERVQTILGAIDEHFRPIPISEEEEQKLREKFGISKPFLLYTGGIEFRKNEERLIQAYAMLPKALRDGYHLVVACKVVETDRNRLSSFSAQQGLASGDLILTGYVSDNELVQLYNLCNLFVFPSLHEGFGLPVLEAMACGAPVIGSNTTSVPEVIGWEDALFDPFDVASISKKLVQALEDEEFRKHLREHGLKQAKKFSWDKVAKRAIEEWDGLHKIRLNSSTAFSDISSKPRLAYISPLPPERSGISDYSAELLPVLSNYYDIDVIVAQNDVTDPWIKEHCPIRDVAWLKKHRQSYDRLLYHIGNSQFHAHMFDLLKALPGVVVLHDFFLSGIVSYMAAHHIKPNYWVEALYHSHGYKAVYERFHEKDIGNVIWRYPCNLSVLQDAKGIIVHSNYSRTLAQKWYGDGDDWVVIPHLRTPLTVCDRARARKAIGIASDDFIVCAFGIMGPTKLNHRLITAWLASDLAKNNRCHLVFVGQKPGGGYGRQIDTLIKSSNMEGRIHITGWVDTPQFRQYLASADVAVQLRTLSRGETSGTILDCMNYGLATIVNAHGSMAELPSDAVCMLPDGFEDMELVNALETLWRNEGLRRKLGERARELIRTRHAPALCAQKYFEAIEGFYGRPQSDSYNLSMAIANLDGYTPNECELSDIATSIACSMISVQSTRQLLIDISELIQRDVKSGIQRVVRSILGEWLLNPPEGYRVEPVYATVGQGYRYARGFISKFLGCEQASLKDEPIDYTPGDIFFALDLQPHVQVVHRNFYQHLRRQGVKIYFLVYDLLCVLMPQYFGPGAAEGFSPWLDVVSQSDGAITISKVVADDLTDWVKFNGQKRLRPFNIAYAHIGADIDNSQPTRGMPPDAETTLKQLRSFPSFLMVGTLEPRKGHMQVLDAFERLWQSGLDVNLVIVGKQGWMVDGLVARLRSHPELNRRLFWLEGISDEYLEKVYAASTCLIAASYGEGFGLPLIEAAQHKLPIIARDIPVFREVAGEHAFYFPNDKSPDSLVTAIEEWLKLYRDDKHPKSDNMPYLTWKQSAQNLLDIILNDRWVYEIFPDRHIKLWVVYNHKTNRLNWVQGWSKPESNFRWSEGHKAIIEFSIAAEDVARCQAIRLKFNVLGQQRMSIVFNDSMVFDGEVEGSNHELILASTRFYEGINRIVFHLPDARKPGNGDSRILAIAMIELELLGEKKG